MNRDRVCILLVDDDEDDYIITRDLLREIEKGGTDSERRFDLDWVATYEAGLAAIQNKQHDVYLLDYRLGERTGLELLREAIARGCQAPLILLTGQGDQAVDLEATQAGAADYLVKGQFDAPLLERSIRYAIRHKQSEEALRKLTADLGERVKELSCLYGISNLFEQEDRDLAEILQGVVDLLPPAWRYPENTCARITLDSQEFRTENFRETPWKQVVDISIYGDPRGRIEVYDLGQKPEKGGLFLKEEKNLLNAVGERVGRIVERKWSEQALQQSEERHRIISELTSDYIYSAAIDVEGGLQVEWVTGAIDRITGYHFEEINAKEQGWISLIHPDSLAHSLNLYAKLLSGQSIVNEYQIVTKSGETRWLYDHIKPIWDETEQRVTRIVGGVQDITERKQAEEALHHYTRRLKALHEIDQAILVAQLPEAIAQAALSHLRQLIPCFQASVVEFNTEAQEIRILALYVDGKAGPGRNITVPMTEAKMAELFKEQQRIPLRNTPSMTALSLIQQEAQDQKEDSFITVPLRFQDELIGALKLELCGRHVFASDYVDILHEVATSLAVAIGQARLYEQIRQDAKTKSALLNEINHRVKNNMAAIMGLFYAERRHLGVKDQPVYQAIMKDLINRIQSMATVHNLLSASQWSPLSLEELTRQVIRSTLQLLPSDKYISVQVYPSVQVKVPAKQANGLALIINELMTNTIKYALPHRPAASVTVSITREDPHVLFEFRDDGPGYPEEILKLEHSSVGMYLIRTTVQTDLRGSITLKNDQGAVALIRFQEASS